MCSQQTSQFLQALQLPPDLTEKPESCSHAISELVSLAVRDPSHSVSLRDIHNAVSQYDCVAYLEPLDVLPTLLPCNHDGAMDLIRDCASRNSPKEVMIVLQEAIERLQTRLDDDEEDDSDQADEDDNDNEDLVQTTIGIVSLCSPAISRSTLGKRSALELCSPVLENVTLFISSVSSFTTKEEGRTLVTEVAHLVQSLSVWASAVADANANGLREIKSLLRELLDTTVVSCAPSIQASLAVRAAESHLPRFFVKSTAKEGWKEGEGAMRQVQVRLDKVAETKRITLYIQLALECLGDAAERTGRKPSSFSELVYLAYSSPPVPLSPSAPSDLLCLLLNALEANMIVDESLFLIFRILTDETMSISLETAESLCTTLTALASTHLDPTIRQLNLRLLSLTLTKLPSLPRIEMLLNLTMDEQFPQIRGPAVGLVKEAVLEALALPPEQASRNPLATSELLRIFGGVLFRPNPPDFFSKRKTREELAQSLELLRIADCLSFYYVLLQRDRKNTTRVKLEANIMSVQNSLLRPLRQFLDEYNANIAPEEQPLMAMLSLQVGIDRIDAALRSLDMGKEVV